MLKFQLSGVAGSGYKDSSCSPVHSSSEGWAGGQPAADYCSDKLIIVQLVYIESLSFCITLQWCHTVILSYDTIICLVFAPHNLHLLMYYPVFLVTAGRRILEFYGSGKLQLDIWTLGRAGAEYLHHGHSHPPSQCSGGLEHLRHQSVCITKQVILIYLLWLYVLLSTLVAAVSW